MTRDVLGSTLLVLVAHPDDESFIAASLLRENADAGGTAVLICATKGERGMSHLRRPMTMAALRSVRARELRRACSLLGIKRIIRLSLPDGAVQDHEAALANRAIAVARTIKPHYLVSFGPDGFTGHHDHLAVYRIACTVAHRIRVPLLSATLSRAITARPMSWLTKRRSHSRYRAKTRAHRTDLIVPVNARFKLRVLRCHRSQFDHGKPLSGFPKFAAREILAAEHFTIRRP